MRMVTKNPLSLLHHFSVQEFVPQAVYVKRRERAIEMMDSRIVAMIELLRTNLIAVGYDNPITINDWLWGGAREQCGLRTADSKHYSVTSQHSMGRAIDGISKTPVQVMHRHILENPHIYKYIRFIEIDINWLHIDCRDNASGNHVDCWSPERGGVSAEQYLVELKRLK